jgi:hypothetical protein
MGAPDPPATASGWLLSSVRSFAMRRVREHAVTHNASVVEVGDPHFDPSY